MEITQNQIGTLKQSVDFLRAGISPDKNHRPVLADAINAALELLEATEPFDQKNFKTCNTCFHSDNAHNDGSGRLEVCFVCAAENANPNTVCIDFKDSGCNPCPFCGSGAVIIEAPSAAGGDRVVYDAFCVDEECGARIEGCATKGNARRLWNNRQEPVEESLVIMNKQHS